MYITSSYLIFRCAIQDINLKSAKKLFIIELNWLDDAYTQYTPISDHWIKYYSLQIIFLPFSIVYYIMR